MLAALLGIAVIGAASGGDEGDDRTEQVSLAGETAAPTTTTRAVTSTTLAPTTTGAPTTTAAPTTTVPPTTAPPPTAPPTTAPPVTAAPTVPPTVAPTVAFAPAPAAPSASYANCTEARNAGVTPLYRGDPGYASHLDRDDDGVACE